MSKKGNFAWLARLDSVGAFPGYVKPDCVHGGIQPVFSIGPTDIYAAAWRDARPATGVLVLNCVHYRATDPPVDLPAGYQALAECFDTYRSINLDWSDGQAPPVAPSFWKTLVSLLAKNREQRFLVMCEGSHGRTGTALAAIRMAAFRESTEAAIRNVRELHCKRAIETKTQEEYLETL